MLRPAAIRARLAHEEQGVTLIELLVSIAIGIVVLLGIANIAETGGRASARLTDRTETVQRVRTAMERITRVLRTQACLNADVPPLIAGDANSVTFYSDTVTQTEAGTSSAYRPRKVKLTYSAAGRGSVTQQTWESPTGAAAGTYDTAPTTTRVLIDNVGPGAAEFLRYYSFTDLDASVAAPLDTSLGADPFPANSIVKIVKLRISLQGLPVSGHTDVKRRVTVDDTVYTRNADLSGASDTTRKWGPRCG